MDELDLPRLVLFENYYGNHPPVHIMVANYLGYKPSSTSSVAPSKEVSQDQFNTLLEHLPVSDPEPFMTSEEYLAKKAQVNVE
jgi:hypothetical protein